MAARHTEYRIYPMSVQSIMDELHTPRFLSTMGVYWKFDNIGALQFTYHHNASFTSWGEDITVRLCPVGPDQTRVDVDSVCSMPTQIIDWGSNKDNVYKVFRHLEMYVPQNSQNTSGMHSGYPASQNSYPNGQYGYPGPQSPYPTAPNGYPAPQNTYPAGQNGYPQPQVNNPPSPGTTLSRCPNCGAGLFPDSVFCPQCGSKVQ